VKIKLKKSQVLLLLVLATILPRLYRFDNPVADWHAFRQADTASATREYVKNGIDVFRPRYQDLSNIQSGKDNLEGWRMVEFPIANALIAWIVRLMPTLDLVLVSRSFSILFSLGTTLSLYFLIQKISGKTTASLSALFFALMPFSVFYGRAILPEPALLFFMIFSLWQYHNYLEQKKTWLSFGLSALSLALAMLLKPFVIFLGPVYLILTLQKFGKKTLVHLELLLFLVISFGPFWWWRQWIEQFPSGIPANDWLFNSNQIRLRPAWFRWLFYERLTKLLLGFAGWAFIFGNLLDFSKKKDELAIYGAWGLGLLTYLIVIATGNVQHDYYQVITLPFVAVLLGRGATLFHSFCKKRLGQKSALAIIGATALVSIILSWQNVKGYFNVNHWEYVEAGQVVDQMTPKSAKVIAPAFGDTIFLFQTNRTGWPIGFEIDNKINKGATHYVTTSYDDEARDLEAKYQTLVKTSKYLLLDLTKPLESK